MARSLRKAPFVDASVLEKVAKAEHSGMVGVPIKTWSRRSTILPNFSGKVFHVHNGAAFIPVLVKEDMIQHKLGEFAPTRRYRGHGADAKGKRN